ncbi:hypothetical protein NKH72_21850 [Mesorhizobium sp. M0955]|uniref:hypothetical protein n=1 Tax=Mesorhizobium sp. M0955 TaxID=2957033 RepID=UPI003335EDC6
MPKFVVLKGHDAWVVYETVIEADNAEQAFEFADADRRADIWVATGDVREFDHCEVFEGEVEEVAEGDDEPVERKNYALTGPQRNTVLAALRLWQDQAENLATDALVDIATDGGSHALLSDRDIDDLCEAINQ